MGWEVLFKRLECWAQDKGLTSWIVTWSGSSLKSLNLNTLTFLWEHRQNSGTDHKGWIQVPLIHYCFACHSWRLLQIQRWNQRYTSKLITPVDSWSFRAGCWHENPFADIHWNSELYLQPVSQQVIQWITFDNHGPPASQPQAPFHLSKDSVH